MKRKYIKTLAFGMALTCAVPAMAQNKVVQGTARIQQASAKLRNVFVKALLWC